MIVAAVRVGLFNISTLAVLYLSGSPCSASASPVFFVPGGRARFVQLDQHGAFRSDVTEFAQVKVNVRRATHLTRLSYD